MFSIDGLGGIGMIYFYNPIMSLMRREDIKSMVIGSIGIAPSLFDKGLFCSFEIE